MQKECGDTAQAEELKQAKDTKKKKQGMFLQVCQGERIANTHLVSAHLWM